MPNTANFSTSTATPHPGLWYRWRGYTVRWLLFGLVVSLFQPIFDNLDHLWVQKLNQALGGLVFGAMCAVVFTLAENFFNVPRVKWKSWLFVFLTWLSVKVILVSSIALLPMD
jgi:hypothetical protein